MAFERPSFTTILARVKADFRDELSLTTILRRSVEMAVIYAISGVSHVLHGFIDYLFKMLFWDTAEGNFLRRWASIFAVTKEASTSTQLTILITGDVGYTSPDGTEWQRSDGGIYIQEGDATIPDEVVGVSQVTDIQAIADVSASLNSTYFYIDTPEHEYYAWINVSSTGTDPAIDGRTGVEIDINQDDIADDVANAIYTALGALADMTAEVVGDTVTVTNSSSGVVEDAVDYSTGFTISVITSGIDAVTGEQVEATVISDAFGADTNVDVGNSLSLVAPIDNIDSSAEVITVIQEGQDEEDDESYRDRFLDIVREPPQGGSANDYLQWMNAMTGVTRSWVFPNYLGYGTVGCTFVDDNDEDDIFPTDDEVETVRAALEILVPATVYDVDVFSPTQNEIDLTIKITPNTLAVRTAVRAELEDLFLREAQVKGAYRYPGQTYDGKIALSKIDEAISIAVGEDSHELVSPTSTPEPTASGGILVLGAITWQTLI